MKKAVIRNGKIVYDSESEVVQGNLTEARRRRTDDKADHRKEMLQRNQVEYYKAYKDQLENLSPELRRLLS